jgi:hypothetical protein
MYCHFNPIFALPIIPYVTKEIKISNEKIEIQHKTMDSDSVISRTMVSSQSK